MTNNKLSPVTVYVPVSVKIVPPKNDLYWAVKNDGSKILAEYFYLNNETLYRWFLNDDSIDFELTHWLKEQERFIFTKEELEGLLANTFHAGRMRMGHELLPGEYNPIPLDEKEYIQSLF